MHDRQSKRAEETVGGVGQGTGAPLEAATPALGRARRRVFPQRLRPTRSATADILDGRSAVGTLRRDAVYRRALGAADVLAAGFALVLGVAVLGEDSLTPVLIAAIPAVLLVGKLVGLYDRDEHLLHKTTLDEAPALFQVATLYALLVSVPRQFIVDGILTPEQLLALWVLLFLSLLLARTAARRLVRRVVPAERCVVLGNADSARWLEGKFASSNAVKADILGRLPLEDPDLQPGGPPVLGDIDTMGEVLAQHDVERVIIAPQTSDSDRILDVMRLVKSLGVRVSVLPRLFEVVGSSVEFDNVNGVTLLGLRRYGLSRSSQMLKRTMDVIGSLLGLLLLGPLMLMIAIAIKLTSPGPVLFRQRRIGREDHQFEILKFRTMVADADARKSELLGLNEAQGLFKIAEDPRITKVGRLLRRSSLDELPQFVNVLRGEMSLVGPRPLVVDEDRRVEGWQRRRLVLTPGMTGLWQIFGSARIPLHEMVKIDYIYAANWSLWLDVKVLLRTIPIVLERRGL